jgi:hypothetical protein
MPRRTNPKPRISYIDTKWKRAYNKSLKESSKSNKEFSHPSFWNNWGDGQRMYRVSQNVGIEARGEI